MVSITLSLPEEIVQQYQNLADDTMRSRKAFMEMVLTGYIKKNFEKVFNPPIEIETSAGPISLKAGVDKDIFNDASLYIKGPKGKEDNSHVIFEQIKAIKEEKIPKERDTPRGRIAWQQDQQKRITELEKQLPQLP